jgi:hypothetical protein
MRATLDPQRKKESIARGKERMIKNRTIVGQTEKRRGRKQGRKSRRRREIKEE